MRTLLSLFFLVHENWHTNIGIIHFTEITTANNIATTTATTTTNNKVNADSDPTR